MSAFRPRAGGVLPSPGHEVIKHARHLAELEARIEGLEGASTAQSDALEAIGKTIAIMSDRILALQRRLLELEKQVPR